ncbi:MAG: hypothetical protein ACRDIB_02415, partial [Ardenticatenaceae bacterium]
SRPLKTKARTWGGLELEIVAELNMKFPLLGAGKLALKLREKGLDYSRATVGRMLAKARRRCPLCRGVGRHDELLHILRNDLRRFREQKELGKLRDEQYAFGIQSGNKRPGT